MRPNEILIVLAKHAGTIFQVLRWLGDTCILGIDIGFRLIDPDLKIRETFLKEGAQSFDRGQASIRRDAQNRFNGTLQGPDLPLQFAVHQIDSHLAGHEVSEDAAERQEEQQRNERNEYIGNDEAISQAPNQGAQHEPTHSPNCDGRGGDQTDQTNRIPDRPEADRINSEEEKQKSDKGAFPPADAADGLAER